MRSVPRTVEHMVVQMGMVPSCNFHACMLTISTAGIPIAYPRMVFLESALDSKLNPLVALGRNGSMGLSGFVNKFNADAELLDDLVSTSPLRAFASLCAHSSQNDHWTAKLHKVRSYVVSSLRAYTHFALSHDRKSATGLSRSSRPMRWIGTRALASYLAMCTVPLWVYSRPG